MSVRPEGGLLQLLFALCPGLSQEDVQRTKETIKERQRQNLLLFRGRHEGGHGEKQRLFHNRLYPWQGLATLKSSS